MLLSKHTKFVYEYEGLITLDEVDHLCECVADANPVLQENFRTEERNNNTYDLTEHQRANNIAWRYIARAHNQYVRDNDFMWYKWDKDKLLSLRWNGKNIIRSYDENDEYQWHQDHSLYNIPEVSYILYLNDEFVGGRTLFMLDKLGISPKKGNVLCFPVDHYHLHKSTKISSGTKSILWNCMYRSTVAKQQKELSPTRRNIW